MFDLILRIHTAKQHIKKYFFNNTAVQKTINEETKHIHLLNNEEYGVYMNAYLTATRWK